MRYTCRQLRQSVDAENALQLTIVTLQLSSITQVQVYVNIWTETTQCVIVDKCNVTVVKYNAHSCRKTHDITTQCVTVDNCNVTIVKYNSRIGHKCMISQQDALQLTIVTLQLSTVTLQLSFITHFAHKM